MKKLLWIPLLLLGCGKSGMAGVAKSYADDMCACKTRECLEEVMKKHQERMSKLTGPEVKPDNMQELQEAAADMMRAQECMKKIALETQPH